ncbi:MAG: methyltransferase, partial [Firmicutes bacterium]|nr:methyltransferase [Bacillota bacterium]
CDTATDYALINAAAWNAPVILSVPCCQHELFKQIKNETLAPMLKHGIVKDKFTELLTDGLRGLALEARGYDVQMIEFTTLEHTQKNIMIRAIKRPGYDDRAGDEKSKRALQEYNALKDSFKVEPTIEQILPPSSAAAAEAATD